VTVHAFVVVLEVAVVPIHALVARDPDVVLVPDVEAEADLAGDVHQVVQENTHGANVDHAQKSVHQREAARRKEAVVEKI
jgi:hypothetical protein